MPDAVTSHAAMMKAYVYHRYGGPEVVELAEVPRPMPGDDEVLVRIRATTVTAGDWRVRTLAMPRGFGPVARLAIGIVRPRQPIMGTELAGVVTDVGSRVRRFAIGDEVFAFPGGKMGAHAEYRTMPEDGAIALKPANLSFDEAASLPFGASTALHFLAQADLRSGEEILVVGASGAVGTALVQLAKHRGARVTAVSSGRNSELVRSLGADDVIDYTTDDPARSGRSFAVIVDTAGSMPFTRSRPMLRPGGRFVAIAGGMPEMLAAMRTSGSKGARVIAGPAEERPEYLAEIKELAERGVLRPVIDRTYEFDQMRDAHAYVETRRKRGSVVVRLTPWAA
jgi:NADPH:quinone reductase-like Zn-dependent oxidoreductase